MILVGEQCGRTQIPQSLWLAGPVEASSIVTKGGLDPERVCGVAALHGSYPSPNWPPPGFPDKDRQMHLSVGRSHRSQAYCEGTPEFEAFAASVRAWLADADSGG